MQKLFGVIEQNLSNPGLNVEILCKGVGMGRANFYRKLKAITDLSPVDLIRNKRLEIAARMLLETDMNISEVSANIGSIPMLILLLVSKRCTACRRPNMCNKIKKIYIMYKLLLYVILLLFCQCKRDHSLKEEVTVYSELKLLFVEIKPWQKNL